MSKFRVTGYVVTGLIEYQGDLAPRVIVYGIRNDENNAKELFKNVVEEEKQSLKLSGIDFNLQRTNEKEIRIIENKGDCVTTIDLHKVYEEEKEED